MTKYLPSILFCLFFSVQATAEKIVLRLPPKSPEAQYIKEVLTLAYKKINYDITWLEIGGIRELELANNSKIDGALARAPAIEQEFPDLVKIPYPLLSFQLLKISNRRVCGYCLNQDIKSIAYAKSSRISKQYIQKLPQVVSKSTIVDPQNLYSMLKKSRVDTILAMNFQIPDSAFEDPDLIIEVIEHELDFHYLSPQKSNLKASLLNSLRSLDKQGELKKLQDKYQINRVQLSKKPESNKLIIISPSELSLTHNNSLSNHNRIVDKAFEQHFLLDKQSVNWKKLISDFNENKVDIIAGIAKQQNLPNAIYSTFHLSYLPSLIAFSNSDEINKLLKTDINSLELCSEISASFIGHQLNIASDSTSRQSLTECIEKLNNGKTDAVVIFASNFDHRLKNFKQVKLTKRLPLFMAFRADKHGRYLKQQFDSQVKKLAKENKMKQLYSSEIQYKQALIRPN